MSTSLTNLLQDIVKKAADAPSDNADLSRMRKRFQNCTDAVVMLLDISGSMNDLIGHSDMRKIEHLKIALDDLLKAHPKTVMIAFGSSARRVENVDELMYQFLNFSGSTNLTEGIRMAAELRPRRTVIISDGVADNAVTATDAIDQLTGRVDCVYCGPDGHPAVAFLQSLARKGGGDQMTFDGCRELSPMIRGLFA